MQGIYNWLAAKAKDYQKQREIEKSNPEKNMTNIIKNIISRKKQYYNK